MTALVEQQGIQYEMQDDYRLPCVMFPNESNYEIGTLDNYLADTESQTEKLFE